MESDVNSEGSTEISEKTENSSSVSAVGEVSVSEMESEYLRVKTTSRELMVFFERFFIVKMRLGEEFSDG